MVIACGHCLAEDGGWGVSSRDSNQQLLGSFGPGLSARGARHAGRRAAAWGCLGQFNQFNRKGYPLVMTNIAIENDHRNSGFSHESWWFSIAMLVITKGYEDQKTTFFPFFPRFFCIMIIMALGCTRQPVELQPWFHEDEFWTLCVVNGSEDPLI